MKKADLDGVLNKAEKRLKVLKSKATTAEATLRLSNSMEVKSVIAEVTSSLNSLIFPSVTNIKRETLTKLGFYGAINESVVRELELLVVEKASIDRVISRISALKLDYNALSKKVSMLCKYLDDFVDDSTGLAVEEGYGVLEVTFKGEASMGNVDSFKVWAERWHTIGRGYAMAFDRTPQDLKITHVSNGSIVLSIAAWMGVVIAVAKSANLIMDALLKYQKLRDYRIGLEKGLDANNDSNVTELIVQLNDAIEGQFQGMKETVIEELKATNTINENAEAELRRAVKELIGFLDSGGELDYPMIENLDVGDRERLASLIDDLKKLKEARELLLLENKRDKD